MTNTAYFHAFESILYGIALSHIFIGLGRIISNRQTIRFYWAFNLLIGIGTVAIMRQFYTGLNSITFDIVDSPLSFILVVALNPCSFVLLAHLVIPEKFDNLDFRQYYQRHRMPIFIVLVIQQITQVIENVVDGYLLKEFSDWSSFLTYAASPFFLIFVLLLSAFIIVDIILIFNKSHRIFEIYMCVLSLFILLILFIT